MISAQLARSMDGTLRAANLDGGGACFVIALPAAIAVIRSSSNPPVPDALSIAQQE